MYKLMGSDGLEYGPVPAGTIKEWISQGRATAQTRVREENATEWGPIANVAEFAACVPAAAPPAAPAQLAPIFVQAESAGRGGRLLAVVVDALLGAACWLPALYPDPSIGLFLCYGCLLVFAATQILLLTTRGQTVGKMLIGVRIVRYDEGTNAGFLRAVLLRAVLPGIIMLVPVLGQIFSLVDVCFIFREDRRCLHDLIAGTEVVKA